MGVPNSIIVPFVGVSFDSSRATSGPAEMPFTALVFGQKIASGTMDHGVQYLVTSDDEVGALAGYGSGLHRAAIKWFKNNRITTTYVMSAADAAGAVASSQPIPISGTATEVGEVALYVDGDRYGAPVGVATTADEIGALLVNEIASNTSAPVTAAYAGGVLTLTAKTPGGAVGDIVTLLNYYDGERNPAGITATIGTFVPGSGDPDVDDIIDNVGDTWFNILAAPYSDATNMGKIEDYLESRAGVMEQKDGVYFTAQKGTRSELITFATSGSRNSPYAVLIAATNQPHGINDIAAAVAARTAESAQQDPAKPFHRMALTGILPVPITDRWTTIERNQLVQNGVATLSQDNGVQTEGTVTMYLKNSAGASDIAYQYQNTVFILMRLRYRFVNRILTKYPRAKLANSAERMRSGQQVITPDLGKAEAVAWFLEEELDGQVENLKQFKVETVCRRSTSNPNRLEWILPTDLINQFIIGSADLQFILQGSN